jgi:hypothetical protein
VAHRISKRPNGFGQNGFIHFGTKSETMENSTFRKLCFWIVFEHLVMECFQKSMVLDILFLWRLGPLVVKTISLEAVLHIQERRAHDVSTCPLVSTCPRSSLAWPPLHGLVAAQMVATWADPRPSFFEDIGFASPRFGDLRLSKSSPAWKITFISQEEIDVGHF